MRRILPFLLLCWATYVAAQAPAGRLPLPHIPGAATTRQDPQTGRLSYVHFHDSAAPDLKSLSTHPGLGDLLQAQDLRPFKTMQDGLGMSHTRLQAHHEGHPVEGAVAILHARQGRISALNADLPATGHFSGSVVLTASQARENAATHVGARQYMWQVPGVDNLLRAETGDPHATYAPVPTLAYVPAQGDFEKGHYRLAWKVDVYATQPLSRDYVFVDAENGAILWQNAIMQHVDRLGTAKTAYSGTQPITTDQTGPGAYRLREFVRQINTYNLQSQENYADAVDFWSVDNVWDEVNAQKDEYATDCHVSLEVAYDYFKDTYGWIGLDGNRRAILAYVHFGTNFENAFWDGDHLGFGDGSGFVFNSPTTTPDIVGHELMHAITRFSSGLYYDYGQSGALNEAYSDIFGKVIENKLQPTTWNWLVARQCTPGGTGIRDMRDPNVFNCPDTYLGRFYRSVNDPHINSGIPNKWFQVLVDGETGVNDRGQSYQVTGIGMDKAAAIAFRCLTVYLNPISDFADAQFYSMRAAQDLYGDCSQEFVQTANAWQAVGIGQGANVPPVVNFASLMPNSCQAPATIKFENRSTAGDSYWWDFGDGTTSTFRDPEHTYASLGSYDVKLVVTSCTGQKDSLTRQNYVRVDPQLPCIYLMPPFATQPVTLQDCEGYLLDAGGYGDYPTNNATAVRIHPPGAAHVALTFSEFSTEPTWDALYIYDGPDDRSPLVAWQSGSTAPFDGRTWVSSGPFVYLRFSSNNSIVGRGFKMSWTCQPVVAPPVADFEVAPISCDGVLELRDVAVDGVETWLWDFGDGTTSTEKFPVHQYLQSGTYDITLTVCNALGCHTLTRPAAIRVDLGSSCATPFPLGSTTLWQSCHGRMRDPGGEGNYGNLQEGYLALNYSSPTLVALDFKSFALEDGHDYLDIAYTIGDSGYSYQRYTGNTLPDDGHLKFITKSLELWFESDSAGTAPGFLFDWQAYNVSSDLVARFDAPDAVSPASLVQFDNQSQNVRDFRWEFGDGTTSQEANPSHRYQNPGTYTVTLNAKGMDDACVAQFSRKIQVCRGCTGKAGQPMLSVWPNPSTGLFEVIAAVDGEAVGRFVVFDVVGKRLLEVEHAGATSLRREIDLRDVESGIYYIRYETDAGDITRKLVVQR